MGKVHYINDKKFVASDLCFILTPKDSINTNLKYYYAYFNSRRKEIVQRLARGTNKKSINDMRFKNYVILNPDKKEQDRIGAIVDEIFKNIESYKKSINVEYLKLNNLI